MPLNKQRGNMYGFVTHTWNAIKGECRHNCSYCYMKRFPQKALHLEGKELNTNLGEGNFIFVGSSTDMFAGNVPEDWIKRTLEHCRKFPKNKYLFQSKNPKRMLEFRDFFPPKENCIWATTIETNKNELIEKYSNAPLLDIRSYLKYFDNKMVTIEPIIDFDLEFLIKIIKEIKPLWVNVGADSNTKLNLPEPSKEKILALIKELNKFTKVINKENLDRILNKSINQSNEKEKTKQ